MTAAATCDTRSCTAMGIKSSGAELTAAWGLTARRQRCTRFAFNPLASATPATEAPGRWLAAAILALYALEKRRCLADCLTGIISLKSA